MRNKDAKLIWISNEKFFDMSSAFLKWPKSFKEFFTFNCCSECYGITLNLKYSDVLYHLHFYIS